MLDLAAQHRRDDRPQRLEQDRAGGGVELAKPRVAAEAAGQQLGLVQEAVVTHQGHEGLLVAVAVVAVVDLEVGAGPAAQAHDLAHRRHLLGAGVDAVEAVGAVVDPVLVLGEVLEPLRVLGVARVADEAVGLGQGGGADEQRVDLHREAVRHAGAALDAGHRLGDVDHVLVGHDVLALGDRLLVDEVGGDPLDLLPVHRVHVHDQVADDGHVAHRLDLDHARRRGARLALALLGIHADHIAGRRTRSTRHRASAPRPPPGGCCRPVPACRSCARRRSRRWPAGRSSGCRPSRRPRRGPSGWRRAPSCAPPAPRGARPSRRPVRTWDRTGGS